MYGVGGVFVALLGYYEQGMSYGALSLLGMANAPLLLVPFQAMMNQVRGGLIQQHPTERIHAVSGCRPCGMMCSDLFV